MLALSCALRFSDPQHGPRGAPGGGYSPWPPRKATELRLVEAARAVMAAVRNLMDGFRDLLDPTRIDLVVGRAKSGQLGHASDGARRKE